MLPLPTLDGRSDPRSVLERLKREGPIDPKPFDEFWLVLDTDHHVKPSHIANLTSACTEAVQAGYGLALSNPSWEAWLVLHLTEAEALTGVTRAAGCEDRLRELHPAYVKNHATTLTFVTQDTARAAIARASAHDDHARWPQAPGTHAHRLVERLLAASTPR